MKSAEKATMRHGGGVSTLDIHADLRLAVHHLRRTTRSRDFRPMLHLGAFDGDALHWFLDETPAPDVGLRAEIVAALLSRALLHHSRPVAWLTRPGTAEPHDLDLDWVPVVARVFLEDGIAPDSIAVVTKSGWYEPLGDQRTQWKRLRMRGRSN